MSSEVLLSVKMPPLLEAISSIVSCHARFVTPASDKATIIGGSVGSQSPGSGGKKKGTAGGGRGLLLVLGEGCDLDELPGGSITLSIVFGLLSAILGGGREVSNQALLLLWEEFFY